jgi:nucleotide-binding universal stress UspA family protein
MYEKVLVPLDGSPLAESVLPHAEEIAAKFGAELVLVRVVASLGELVRDILPQGGLQTAGASAERSLEVAERQYETERAEAERYLEGIAESLRAKTLKVENRVEEGGPSRAILAAAGTTGANLIAMSTHSRTGLPRSVLGSVADEVVRESHLPVLLIHP